MREQIEASFENEDEIENHIITQIRTRAKHGFIAIAAFTLIVATLALYRYYSTAQLVKDGQFYHDELLSLEMLPFWKELGEEEQQENKQQLIDEGEHNISRKELGNMGWTILHMMTGAFPEDIPPNLVKKWNAFLILFGQFYPCKLCSTHFLKMLKQVGPFQGTKKEELMKYLCNMHNIVNKRLGKPHHDCKNVKQQWNTCGCTGEL